MPNELKREVKYLNRDFSSLRNSLIDFTKQYFPETYQDFNESSPGMMFLELSSYIGDVLGFYIDSAFKENLLLYAEEKRNIYAIAQAFGYRPKITFPGYTTLDVFQIVPAVQAGLNVVPNYDYALTIKENLEVSSQVDPNVVFRTVAPVDFRHSSSIDTTDTSIYEVDDNNIPTFFVLKKRVDAVAGKIEEAVFTFGSPEKFSSVTLEAENFIEIISATDADGNAWYPVDFLAQDTIYEEVLNVAANDPDLAGYNDTAPYLLKLRKTARRFIHRVTPDDKINLQFGAGISSDPDELIIPNPTNIGSAVFGSVKFSNNPIDPANFLYTRTYGQAPNNTTITVKYTTGGGYSSNVNSNDLVNIVGIEYDFDDDGLDASTVQTVKDSVAVTNPEAARGGRDGETVDEVRHNALAHFATQLRAVTKEDYITRAYSLPARFGNIGKAYITQDDQLNKSNQRIDNPLALNLYVLGYDSNKRLTTLNKAVKENLKVYLGQYRMLTDAVNIKDGFIINIAVKFDIIAFSNYNKREVVLRCTDKLKRYFNSQNWQFNQPIYLSDIQRELFSVEGVQSVVDVVIENKYSSADGYSGNIYNIKDATRNNIIYPSIDPSIFEVRFLNRDIIGRAL